MTREGREEIWHWLLQEARKPEAGRGWLRDRREYLRETALPRLEAALEKCERTAENLELRLLSAGIIEPPRSDSGPPVHPVTGEPIELIHPSTGKPVEDDTEAWETGSLLAGIEVLYESWSGEGWEWHVEKPEGRWREVRPADKYKKLIQARDAIERASAEIDLINEMLPRWHRIAKPIRLTNDQRRALKAIRREYDQNGPPANMSALTVDLAAEVKAARRLAAKFGFRLPRGDVSVLYDFVTRLLKYDERG